MDSQLSFAAVRQSTDSVFSQLDLQNLKTDCQVCRQFMATVDGIGARLQADNAALGPLSKTLQSFAPQRLASGYIAQLIEVGTADSQLLEGLKQDVKQVGIEKLVATIRTSQSGTLSFRGSAAAKRAISRYASATSQSLMDIYLKLLVGEDPRGLQRMSDIASRVWTANVRAERGRQEEAKRAAREAYETASGPKVLGIIVWIVLVIMILAFLAITSRSSPAPRIERYTLDPVRAILIARLREAERIGAGCIVDMKAKYEECLRRSANAAQIRRCTAKYLAGLAKECRLGQ